MASWKVAPALAAGQHRDPQARQLLPVDGDPARRAGTRGGHPGRASSTSSPGPGGSAGASIAAHPGIGKVAFTGETTTGQEIMRLAAGQREEDLARARRQEPEHRLRRRGPREVRPRVAVFGLRQRRPGLLRAEPDPRRAVAPTTRSSSCSPRRPGTSRSATRPTTRPRSARSSASSSATASATTSRSGSARARRSSSAARRPTIRRWPTAPT